MKHLFLATALSVLSISTLSAANPSEGRTASTNIPMAQYPCVDSQSRATFKIHAPEAKDVKVDICGKKYDMTRGQDGVWSVTTAPLVEGFHYYFLLVDGVHRQTRSMVADVRHPALKSLSKNRQQLTIHIIKTFLTDRLDSVATTQTTNDPFARAMSTPLPNMKQL